MVTALVAWACGMEHLGAVKLVGVVIGVAAAGYRISAKEQVTLESESQPLLVGGVILVFLLCAAVYALLNKQINTKYNGATITAWGFCSATVFFALTAVGYFVHLAATAHQGSAADRAAFELAVQDELQLWWPLHWTTTQLCLLWTTLQSQTLLVPCCSSLSLPHVAHKSRCLPSVCMDFAAKHFEVSDSRLALAVMAVGNGVPQICVGLRSGGVHSPELQSNDLLAAAPRCNHRHDVRASHFLQHSHVFCDICKMGLNQMYCSPLPVETRYDLAEPVGTITTLLVVDGRLPTLLVSPDSPLFVCEY